MTGKRLHPAYAAFLVLALVAPLGAHQLPVEVVAYVKAEAGQLRVLVRLPAAVLADARLPVRADGYLDLQAIDGPMDTVASYVTRSLDVMRNDRPLPPPKTAWMIARPPDASFDAYESAVKHFASPRLPADAALDPDAVLVDLSLEYPLAPEAADRTPARYSIRVNDFRVPNRAVQMRVHSMIDSDGRRALITSGPVRRVTLNPRWRSVLAAFGRLGLDQIALGANHLLFLLVLAIPRRPLRSALSLLAVFAAGFVVSLALSGLIPDAADPSRVLTIQSAAAAMLVVAGLQIITSPQLVWVRTSAALFGILDGVLFGYAYRASAPLAGSHTLMALAAFAAPVLLASLWFLLVAKPLVGFVYRSALPERWATVFLSAIPIHAGLHGMGLL